MLDSNNLRIVFIILLTIFVFMDQYWHLIISSPEPKAQVSYCDRFSSVVRRPSCVVRKRFTFSSSPKCMVAFQPNFVGIILRGKRSKVVKMVHVALRGARGRAPKGKNYVNFKHLLLQIGN